VSGGPFVFTSGQLGLNPKTNSMVEGGVESETRQALLNLKAVLEAANSCMNNVVKTTVFLRDMTDFAKMNAIYGEFFSENPPARSAVQVAALPKNAAVEIEAIAMTSKEE
jgi:2-iminobutanoate/2-iminopropanoate deaminase